MGVYGSIMYSGVGWGVLCRGCYAGGAMQEVLCRGCYAGGELSISGGMQGFVFRI